MSCNTGSEAGASEPAPGPGAVAPGSGDWLPRNAPVGASEEPVAPWVPCGARSPDGAGEPAGTAGAEGVNSEFGSWLRGAKDPSSGAEAPEFGGSVVTGARRSTDPVGALPSGLTDGMTPGLTAAAESRTPAPGCPPFLAPTPLSFFFFLALVVRLLPDRLAGALPFVGPLPFLEEGGGRPDGPGARGSGIASSRDWSLSLRACSQESISRHWSAEKPMQSSHGSRLVQVLQAGQMEWGSQVFPGRN